MIRFFRLKIAIILVIFCSVSNIANASFATSCALVPAVITGDSLNTKTTAYGNLQAYIQSPSASICADNNPNFIIFNLRTQYNQSSTIQVQLSNGYTGTIAQAFAGLSDIATDPIMGNVNLSVSGYNDNTLCLFMPTTFGNTPVFCKKVSYVQTPKDVTDQICSVAADSCYSSATVYSMSPFNFTGKAYQCLTESLNKIFYLNTAVCTSTDGVSLSLLNPFVNFQNALRSSIGAALLLYIMFFGIRILLGEVEMKASSFIGFVMKFILVLYFAVGLGPISYTQGNQNQQNGTVTWALPFLTGVIGEFSNIVFNAGGAKSLCNFDPSKYPAGYDYYGIWDSIDCRLGYYLGLKMLAGLTDEVTKHTKVSTYNPNNATIININDNIDNAPTSLKKGSAFGMFDMMFGFLFSGNIILFIISLIFALVFISILLSFFSSILVCVATLYAMLYISPIFVPMALFDRTKGYFDSWLRLLVGVSLQPAILVGFLSLMITVYDSAIYNNCVFVQETYAVPSLDGKTNYNMNIYRIAAPVADSQSCTSSIGVKMAQHLMGYGWQNKSLIIMKIFYLTDSLSIAPQMVYLMILTFIFYFFASSVQDLAAELSGGPHVGSASVSVGAVIEGLKNAGKAAMFAAKTYATKGQNLKEAVQKRLPQGQSGGAKNDGSSGGGAEAGKDGASSGGSAE